MDIKMKNIIEDWGIPNVIKSRNIGYVFDSEIIENLPQGYENLMCEYNEVKFCLYDFDNKKIIFSMQFYESSNRFLMLTKKSPSIKLELLNINDSEMRNKGIASYYIKRLQEYAKDNNYSYIRVSPCPDADIFENQSKDNTLELEELKNFYRRKSTKEMPIEILGEC